jgi:hypothetical protein
MPKKMKGAENMQKNTFLHALEKSLGIVTQACKSTGIAKSTFYDWLKKDKEFAGHVDAVKEVVLDFAESSLHKQINAGNTSATIFFLKCRGSERGYIEKSEVHNTNVNLNTDLTEEERLEALKRVKDGLDEFSDYE